MHVMHGKPDCRSKKSEPVSVAFPLLAYVRALCADVKHTPGSGHGDHKDWRRMFRHWVRVSGVLAEITRCMHARRTKLMISHQMEYLP